MYELFVLGELMDGPHHGYLLREILGRLLGPFRHISCGVLYPLIRQLEREGLIVPFEEDGNEQSVGADAIGLLIFALILLLGAGLSAIGLHWTPLFGTLLGGTLLRDARIINDPG